MSDMMYGKIIVIADVTQSGSTVSFASGSTTLTATVGANSRNDPAGVKTVDGYA